MKESKIKTHIFISYARSDASEVASLLQRRLEGYRIPRKLVSKDVPLPDSKYLRRVFVDKEDLSVSKGSFHEQLKKALDDAEYLLVLCSKAAARPDSFVHKEIAYFMKKNSGDLSRILPIALDGVGDDAVPEELRSIVKERNIVLWDRDWETQRRLGKAHIHSAFFKVLEFLLGVEAGVLNNRYWIAWRRRIIHAACIWTAVMLSLVGVLTHDVINQIHRVKFEKQVFPLSIDYSYMEAFAAPLVGFETNKHNIIIAAMPKNYEELGNKPGVKKIKIQQDLVELGWTYEKRQYSNTNWSRPLETAVAMPKEGSIEGTNVFVDVVSQLSAVKKVLDYLTKDNQFYSIDEQESLTQYYVNEFKTKLVELMKKNETIKGCSWEFKFVTDKDELKAALDSIRK